MRSVPSLLISHPGRASAPLTSSATPLPRSLYVGVAGSFGIVLVIVGAVVLRGPMDDDAFVANERSGRLKSTPTRVSPSGNPASAATAPSGAMAGGSPSSALPGGPTDAREAQAKFSKDVRSQRLKEAVASLAQLLELDPDAPRDSEVRGDIVELAMRVMLLEGPEPDAVFEQISAHMGTTGADILYELITTRGGSRAAKRAEEMLKDEGVRARGSPALRVTYALRTARSCEEKIALFDRAKTDGDGRTMGQLQILNKSCSRRSGDCCLHNDPRLREATDAIKSRLE